MKTKIKKIKIAKLNNEYEYEITVETARGFTTTVRVPEDAFQHPPSVIRRIR